MIRPVDGKGIQPVSGTHSGIKSKRIQSRNARVPLRYSDHLHGQRPRRFGRRNQRRPAAILALMKRLIIGGVPRPKKQAVHVPFAMFNSRLFCRLAQA